MAERPNFLFIITDQQRADHLSCAGNAVLRTPNIDKIAANGTRFTRFYANSPICMPARATLMTGRMPTAHRLRGNGVPLSTDTTTVTELLQAAGYSTGLIGKCHLQNMMSGQTIERRPSSEPAKKSPPAHLSEAFKQHEGEGPYDQELESKWTHCVDHDIRLPYYGFEHVDLCINHGDLVHGHYGRWLEHTHPNSASLRGPENALTANIVAPEAWRTRMPVELYPTSYIADRTIEYLQDHVRSDTGRPFFLQCSFTDPHHPFTPPGGYFDLYDPDDVELPPSFHQPLHQAIPQVRYVRELLERGERDIEVGFAYAVTEAEARQAIALTYGMIALIDDAVGRVMVALNDLGLAENTVVVFTSDHGDFMGDHRLLLKGPLHYRGVINVPFVWSDPTAGNGARTCSALACGLDFAPTILDRAGLRPFHGMQGRSLMPLASGEEVEGHDSVLIEEENQRDLFGIEGRPRVHTLVAGDWRVSIYNEQAWGELYDLKNDPHELQNLWDDPKYSNTKAEMLERLSRRILVLGDRSPFPTGRA